MVRFLTAGRRAQPYFFGETDFHSPQAIPCPASQAISSFQIVEAGPSLAATSLSVGGMILPIKAFGRSILTFFLDSNQSLPPLANVLASPRSSSPKSARSSPNPLKTLRKKIREVCR